LPRRKDPEWLALHGVADYHRKEFQRSFLRGIREFIDDEVVLKRIKSAFQSGNITEIESAIPWDMLSQHLDEVTNKTMEIIVNGANVSKRYLPEKIAANVSFDLLNQRAVDFIREYRFDLIREITEKSRQGVRKIIERAFTEGMHPYKAARYIRDVVGLTEMQTLSVDNFRRRMLRQGLSQGDSLELAQRYAQRVLRKRAEAIARTETIRAASMGQALLWQEAADKGLIDTAKTWRVWLVTPDDRLCDLCETMDGQRVRLNENFNSPLGPVYTSPLHVNCRCAIVLEFED